MTEHTNPRRALLVHNTQSRQGAQGLEPLRLQLEKAGVHCVEMPCEASDRLLPRLIAAAPRADLIIAAGGDGTVNAVAAGAWQTGLPLGLLPLGTANDLARTLDIPLDPRQAADIIIAGHQRAVDLGSVNDHLFFNVASLGLSADLAQVLSSGSKRRFGRIAYGLAAVRALARAHAFAAVIRHAGGVERARTLQIAVGNGRFYGGGNVVHQDAAIDDGTLHLYSLEVRKIWKLVLMARAFRLGRHGQWREVRALDGPFFDVVTRRPRPINADGEMVTKTPARFRVHPRAIRMFVPELVSSAPQILQDTSENDASAVTGR